MKSALLTAVVIGWCQLSCILADGSEEMMDDDFGGLGVLGTQSESTFMGLCRTYAVKLRMERRQCTSAKRVCAEVCKTWKAGSTGWLALFEQICRNGFSLGCATRTAKPPPSTAPKEVKTLFRNCEARGGCMRQSAEVRQRKTAVASRVADDLRRSGQAASSAEAKQTAQRILSKTLAAKKETFKAQGIYSFAEPKDDGLWGGDMSLSEEQADFIIRAAANPVSASNIPEPGSSQCPKGSRGRNCRRFRTRSSRSKRFALFMKDVPYRKWDLPIPFLLESTLESSEKQSIRLALRDIESKTCIRFKETSRKPSRASHILFRNYFDPMFCGQSPVGDQGENGNTIWLNFACSKIKGTIVHETLHSLGMQHEHNRVERDSYVKIDWNNLDPQDWDLFDARPYSSSFSSYGIPYDYHSVMHYSAFVGGIDEKKPVLTAKKLPKHFQSVMGQRNGLSIRDAQKLSKIYCTADTCRDEHIWCGFYATKDYCMNSKYFNWMKSNCRLSCDFCPQK